MSFFIPIPSVWLLSLATLFVFLAVATNAYQTFKTIGPLRRWGQLLTWASCLRFTIWAVLWVTTVVLFTMAQEFIAAGAVNASLITAVIDGIVVGLALMGPLGTTR